jgi:hypothetical protein
MFEFDNSSDFTQLQTTLVTAHITRQHRSVLARIVVLIHDFKNQMTSIRLNTDKI